MTQLFSTLQYVLKDTTVEGFIKHFEDRRIFQYDDYFLLDRERIQRLFSENLNALKSEITLSPEYFESEQAKLVAMTIDGDYILASDTRTFIVTKNLVKADMEVFELPLIDFFVKYEDGRLVSSILPEPVPLEETTEEVQEVTPEPDTPEKKGFFSRFFNS